MSKLSAQDIHFSQPEHSPINMNPALTGKFDGDYRVTLNHRNQWNSVTVPYKTLSFAFDANFANLFGNNDFAIGAIINSDKAGDSEYGMIQIAIPIAFTTRLTKNKNIDLSIGFLPSFNQKNINYAKLQFNSQYSGGMYNPDLSHGEILPDDNLHYFDLSAGVNVGYHHNKKLSFVGGYSLANITEPNISLLQENGITLNRRSTYYLITKIQLSDKIELSPGFINMKQGQFKENNIGGNFKMKTGQPNITSLFAGTWYRFKDAIVVKGGLEYKNLLIGLSYDFNSSKLTKASHGLGGFEVALVYIFHRKAVFVPKKPCPDFI